MKRCRKSTEIAGLSKDIATILGCALLLFASCSKNEAETPIVIDFSIAIIPDIQVYSRDGNREILNSIAKFISEDKELKIRHCLQTGDLTQHNIASEWEVATQFCNEIDRAKGLTFCLGNHDYGDKGCSNNRSTMLPQNISHSKTTITFDGTPENTYTELTINAYEFGILSLEFATRNRVITWADSIARANTDRIFILLTHGYLDSEGRIYDFTANGVGQEASPLTYQMAPTKAEIKGMNDGMSLWNELIYNNSNIRFVVCGHSLPPKGCIITPNTNQEGLKVYQILVNYQHFPAGGNGFIGILSFDADMNVGLKSYSPYIGQWQPDINYRFSLLE